jgi:hypothetical protein
LLSNVIRVIDSTQVKWARRVAGIAAKLNAKKKSSENLKIRDHVAGLEVGGAMILTGILKKQDKGLWT